MLDVRVILDSPVEAVLDFKCCQLPGLNVEVLVRNEGEAPAVVRGRLHYRAPDGSAGALDLYPYWPLTLAPGEVAAFYGGVDADRLRRCDRIEIEDERGRRYAGRICELTDWRIGELAD